MVRLSSRDASLLMDVLEQKNLHPEERRKLLEGAAPVVRKIGEALIDPSQVVEDEDVKEAVDSIQRWAKETKRSEERVYA
jgi:chaperonin cofactor prefoldin